MLLATSQQIDGGGFLKHGALATQVSVTGLEPDKLSAIVNLQSYLIEGVTDLGTGTIMIGKTLAQDMGFRLGQTVRLQAETGIDASLIVSGIFKTGSSGYDRRQAYVSLATARTLFVMPQGVSKVEIKLTNLYDATTISARIEALTGHARHGSATLVRDICLCHPGRAHWSGR